MSLKSSLKQFEQIVNPLLTVEMAQLRKLSILSYIEENKSKRNWRK